jgi:hypothetical protein
LWNSTYSTSFRETEYNNSAAEKRIALRVLYHNAFYQEHDFSAGWVALKHGLLPEGIRGT